MKLIPILFCAALLAGCSTTRVEFAPTTFSQSPELKSCADAPKKPTGNYTQKDVAKYLKKYEYAHLDCKEDLSSLNAEIGLFNKEVLTSAKKAKK